MQKPLDCLQPSTSETGATPHMVPLFHFEPFQLFDGALLDEDVLRALDMRSQLVEWYGCEAEALCAASRDSGMSSDSIDRLHTIMKLHLLPALLGNPRKDYREYIPQRNVFFYSLRKSGEYSEQAIRFLEQSEESTIQGLEINEIPLMEFAKNVNGNIPIPQVDERIRNIWEKRMVVSGETNITNRNNHLRRCRYMVVATLAYILDKECQANA